MTRRIFIAVLILCISWLTSCEEKFDLFNSPDSTTYSSLSAVLIVGYQEDGTEDAMDEMDKISNFLNKRGLTVHRYYDADAEWEDIKQNAKNASFLIYAGHGSNMGENGKVGGLIINQYVSSQSIMDELELKPNALILFQSVCNGAGSSAGDDGDIGITEAVTRVSDYSYPFFETGATSYYANNLVKGCLDFLDDFFDGENLKSCFEESAKVWAEIELEENYSYDMSKKIAIASTDWGGTVTRISYVDGEKVVTEVPASKNYSIAYVGTPGFTIDDMLEK